MTRENEDWESERVYGHTIERPKGERRCQMINDILEEIGKPVR